VREEFNFMTLFELRNNFISEKNVVKYSKDPVERTALKRDIEKEV